MAVGGLSTAQMMQEIQGRIYTLRYDNKELGKMTP